MFLLSLSLESLQKTLVLLFNLCTSHHYIFVYWHWLMMSQSAASFIQNSCIRREDKRIPSFLLSSILLVAFLSNRSKGPIELSGTLTSHFTRLLIWSLDELVNVLLRYQNAFVQKNKFGRQPGHSRSPGSSFVSTVTIVISAPRVFIDSCTVDANTAGVLRPFSDSKLDDEKFLSRLLDQIVFFLYFNKCWRWMFYCWFEVIY